MLSVLFVLVLDTPKVASASSLRSNEGTQIKDQDTSGTPRRPNAPSLASGVDGLKESAFPLRPPGVGEKKNRSLKEVATKMQKNQGENLGNPFFF